MLPALAHVGAVGFLAHRVEVQLSHQVLKLYIVGTSRRPDFEPWRLPFRKRFDSMTAEDLV